MRYAILILLLIFICYSATAADMPFKRGFNFAGWLQTSSVTQIQFTRFTKQDFIHVKNMGCDHIRLPIHLFNMSGGAPDYTIEPLLFYFLDQIVDWAEELQLHLILDNHSFDVTVNTSPDILDQLIAVWTQIATRYKDRSNLLYYEVLNEPHGIADDTWNNMQQQVIDAIRAIDQKHTIVVGSAGWNSYHNLTYMPHYSDDNLIYTFHFYDPFLFTHQGASWVDPPMDIAGVPFPYDPIRMPDLPDQLKGTWIASNYNRYNTEGSYSWVKRQIDIAVDFQTQRNVPLWCGEFGAYIPNSTTADRARWLELVRSYLEQNSIAWSIWEFAGGFGIYEPGTSGLFDCDVNIPIIEALGLTPPEQKEFELRPDTTGFMIYDDYIGFHIIEQSWVPNGILNYYSEDQPVLGNYCIYWSGVNQYGTIGLRFSPIKDLSLLVNEGFAIDFWVRCAQPTARIDIRFLDTKTDDPGDHPWRIRYTIDNNVAHWDGQWNHLQIPLNQFTEHGSWDNNQWYSPQGDFDWTKIDQFQIVAEYHDLQGIDFYFDHIRIVDPAVVHVDENPPVSSQFRLLQNYPNPFNPTTTIHYQLPYKTDVELSIYNTLGRKIRMLVSAQQAAGNYQATWDGTDGERNTVGSGCYFYQLKAGDFKVTKKMVLLQ